MNRQGSLPALEKATASKTEYRILRAKVLKILDHHFKKDQNGKRLNEDNENSEYGLQKPVKLKTLDLLKMIKNHDTSALSRTIETMEDDTKGSILNGHAVNMSENQELNVKNLCKFVTAEELELICEDPIYFLGRKEYQKNPKLTDYQEWAKQLELAKDRKKKEKNWKETQETAKANLSQSPRNHYFERLSNSNNCTISIIEDKDRIKQKRLQMEDHVRYLKEKNSEMQYMAKMRRLEDEDYKEHMLNEWKIMNMRKSDSVERRLTDRKNKIKRLIFESQQGRDLAQKKLSKWREDKASVEELNKINFEIENIIKQKIVQKQRHQDMIQKVERAKVSGTLRLHKHSDGGKSFASHMISKDTTYEDINTSRGI